MDEKELIEACRKLMAEMKYDRKRKEFIEKISKGYCPHCYSDLSKSAHGRCWCRADN